jgi:multidrug efflux system outer membrane protein
LKLWGDLLISGNAFATVLAVFTLYGCATPPLDEAPSLPPVFDHAPLSSQQWPESDWYREFGSPELTQLIEQARTNNLDLSAAIARAKQADAHARAAGSALLPQIDAGPSVTHASGRSHGQSANETDWSLVGNASYEFDFWGKNAATRDSAMFLVTGSQADSAAVALTVTSSVADEYFNSISLRRRVELARANLHSNREMLAAIEARFNAGAASTLELATQRAEVASAEIAIAPLEQQELEARYALAILLGQPPEGFTLQQAADLSLFSEPKIGAGLPAELLTRRPDIVSAEADLRAAHADLAATRAALFPSLTLTASAGLRNPALDAAVTTLEGTGPSLVVTASLLQTIFDRGQRRALTEEATQKQQELLFNYRAAILHALQDVETAFAAIEHLDAQESAQTQNVEQSTRAFEAARLRYQAGSGDYLSLLEAQRMLYSALDQNAQYRLSRLQAVVALYKALGGGWKSS